MRKQIGALINDYLARLKSGKWEPTSEAAANAIPELWVNDKAAESKRTACCAFGVPVLSERVRRVSA